MRYWQILFVMAMLFSSWFGMQALHELGHVLAALASGGTVQQVDLHPFTISRTDVSPNPFPGWVVWFGPVTGCLSPRLLVWLSGKSTLAIRNSLTFFAGFCLIANGSYIGPGSVTGIGDCGEMLRSETPLPVMWLFGMTTIAAGLYLWHRLGDIKSFLNHPEWVSRRMAISGTAIPVFWIAIQLILFGD